MWATVVAMTRRGSNDDGVRITIQIMHEQIRHRALGAWSQFICRWPGWVLLLASIGVAASIATTVARLEFQSDRNALLSMDLDWNRRFENWRASFPGNEDLYVVVDAGDVTGPSGRDRLTRAQAFIDELGPALQAMEYVEQVVWSFDRQAFGPRTIRLLPMAQFEARLAQIAQSELLLASATPQAMLSRVAAAIQRQAQHEDEGQIVDSLQELTRLIDSMAQVFAHDLEQRPPFSTLVEQNDDGVASPREYLVSETGRLRFIRVTPKKEVGAINALRTAIDAIRQKTDDVATRYEGIEAGLTGIEVVEGDETDAATRDSAIASIVASVLITWMLIGAFGGWRVPLLAMMALLTGVAWTFGFLTLAVGHLQVLSVVFAVILLGLGIAFGIHLVSRVELVRPGHGDDRAGFMAAMRESFQTVGPGVVTGAITTAAAFCMTIFTDFRGVAEMGFIAAAGILLCLLAMFTVLPALLCLFARSRKHCGVAEAHRLPLFRPAWLMTFVRYPRWTLLIAGVLTGASLWAVTQMKFDYDLLKLQPRGVDSVMWQDRITRDGGQSIWSAVSIADSLETARQRTELFKQMDTVGHVHGIGLLFPPHEREKLERLGQVRQKVATAAAAVLSETASGDKVVPDPAVPGLMTTLSTMRLAMRAASGYEMPVAVREPLQELERAIDHVVVVHTALDAQDRSIRDAQLVREYQQWRRAVAKQVVTALDGAPLTVADFPQELLRPYIATKGPYRGSYALEIHPKLPEDGQVDGPLNPKFLPKFIGDLESIDSSITGVIVQIYRSGHLILRSYQLAGLYALAVVFLLVWIDFRSLRSAVLSLVPVAVGFAVTFGVMWLSNVSVNPANIIVLPLMFGIGVDSGVHMLHRYRQDPATRPLGLSGGTGKGITVTSVTTMIGFGSMMIARHRGIASLGFVMTVGIGLTLLACWTVVPAWLELRAKKLATEGTAKS